VEKKYWSKSAQQNQIKHHEGYIDRMSLEGKTVLITRAEHQANELAGLIKKEGATAISFPTIQIKPPASWNDCDQACAQIDSFHGLIFTSTNGVEHFMKHYSFLQYPVASLRNKSVYAVGDKTRQALRRHGINVVIIPDKFTSEDLVKVLTEERVSGKRFLFPRGNLGKHALIDHISALKGEVIPVIVYLTQKTERRNVVQIRQLLHRGSIDVITFTSPSTATNFFDLLPDFRTLQKKVKIAAIGPVTASAIEKMGYHADIKARESTIESLVETIREYFMQP
jgi:uroporphyrinogen III methyltransferase / synthase